MKTIHLIGIGGIGMSGLAKMYLSMGYAVQGSDVSENPLLAELQKEGAKVFIGHDEKNLGEANLVIYSSSIPVEHVERRAANEKGVRMLHRAEALAEICEGKFTLAVTGTHGKTTTTALLGMILIEAGRDPSIVVGGMVNFFGGNAVAGKGPEMVIEADESDSSFLNFSPAVEVITNIEKEHMDHFKDLQAVESAYRRFIERLPKEGLWFGCAEDPVILKLAKEKIRPSVLYGFKKELCEIYAADIEECVSNDRRVSFKVWNRTGLLGEVRMKIIGRHNVLNALAAAGAGLRLGISFEVIAAALGRYEGAGRRFEVKFEDDNFLVVDDYAHHPTEIKKTLGAARALGRKRVVVVFQPHRYSRTEIFMEDFGKSFTDADKLIVTDVYAASEAEREGVNGLKVCESAKHSGHPDASFVPRARVAEHLSKEMRPGDLLLSMGAGDIYGVSREIVSRLRQSLLQGLKGLVLKDEPLSRHTTLKIGGPAEFWVEPFDLEDLRRLILICRKTKTRMTFLGSGSNVLAPDRGLEGVVVHLNSPYFRQILSEKGRIIARGGLPNSLFIQFAVDHDFGGCEFLLGIPGSLGGSIMMNSGSHGEAMDGLIENVTVLDFKGEKKTLRKEEIPFSYRSSGLKDCVVVEACFVLPEARLPKVQKKMETYRDYRCDTQDLQHASAGCMFKNPSGSVYSSGKLIEDAGLKGRRVGNAQVSFRHANFIINLGGASAKDVLELIGEVRAAVKQKFNVELETEVKIL